MKTILKKLFIIALELSLISGALWYVAYKRGINHVSELMPALEQAAKNESDRLAPKPLPELTNPTERTFNWQYKGQKYTLKRTLYQSLDQYYQKQPKAFSYVGTLPANWEDEYYGQFLKVDEKDETITKLANDITELGKQHKLSDDQIVDLTLAFVQSITYDDAKAKDILAKADGVSMRYPYETLFEQLGVCSDKSLLATVLLRQMGYGVAIFAYEQDNHMAIGIQCPTQYSTYGSGYCYAETTALGNKIGIIPDFDTNSNKTVTASELLSASSQQASLQQLHQVTIYQKTTGKEYTGIIQTQKINSQIEQLKKTINEMLPKIQSEKKNIASEEKTLIDMRDQLQKMQNDLVIDQYNKTVEKYNNFLTDYKKDVKKYNSDVALYNQAIQRYNTLIKQ